jgi:hypothetical protein
MRGYLEILGKRKFAVIDRYGDKGHVLAIIGCSTYIKAVKLNYFSIQYSVFRIMMRS